MLATKRWHHGCISALLGGSANPDLTSRDQWSALMIACQAADDVSARLLLGAGASPTAGLHNGRAVVLTPLKLACIGGHHLCVRALLEARASLDGDDGSRLDVIEADGSTMLLYAAQRTHARTPPTQTCLDQSEQTPAHSLGLGQRGSVASRLSGMSAGWRL